MSKVVEVVVDHARCGTFPLAECLALLTATFASCPHAQRVVIVLQVGDEVEC